MVCTMVDYVVCVGRWKQLEATGIVISTHLVSLEDRKSWEIEIATDRSVHSLRPQPGHCVVQRQGTAREPYKLLPPFGDVSKSRY